MRSNCPLFDLNSSKEAGAIIVKTFGQLHETYLSEDKYAASGIDVSDLSAKRKYHDDQYSKLSKELSKHNKTSKEYRHINNDMGHHSNASYSYRHAADYVKRNDSPSAVKAKIKSAENYASKVSGKIPSVAKKPEKITNIHDHVHSKLTNAGFDHEKSEEQEKTQYIRRETPYGDATPINLRGSRTNTIHSYSKPGSKADADKLRSDLKKADLLGKRGNHHISVQHKNDNIHVMHHITGKSKDDVKHNSFEYNFVTGAHLDHPSAGTHYGAWKKK